MQQEVFLFVIVIIILFVVFNLYLVILNPSNVRNKSRSLLLNKEEVVNHVKMLLDKNDYKIAYQIARKYLLLDPSHYTLRYMYAKSMFEKGMYAEAIPELQVLVKTMPERTDFIVLLAQAYQKINKINLAIEVYKKVMDSDPNDILVLRSLAELYKNSNQLHSAISVYNQLISTLESDDEKVEYMIEVSKLYFSVQAYEDALKTADAILKIRVNENDILKLVKNAYIKTGRKEAAIDILKIIISQEPENFDLYKEILKLCIEKEKYDDAIEFSTQALSKPNCDKIYFENVLAKVYIKTNRVEEGMSLIKNTINDGTLFNSKTVLYRTLASAYCQVNNFQEAIMIYNDLIEKAEIKDIRGLKADLSMIYCKYSAYLQVQGKNNEAYDKLLIALKNDENNPEILFKIGIYNYKIKNMNEAIKHFKEAIDIAPQNSHYYMALANTYFEMDNIYDAQIAYEDAISVDPGNSNAHCALGIIYAKQKENEKAISSFKMAINLEPDNEAAHYNLALCYELDNLADKAIEEYQKVIDINPENQEAQNNLNILLNSL